MNETEVSNLSKGDILEHEREMFGAGGSGRVTYRYKVVGVDGDELELLRIDDEPGHEDVDTTDTVRQASLINRRAWHKPEG